ncbi:MAG: FkbM family methyltransferase [Ignavibacteriota bacterium]|jgi:FkbM family methyltransferase|uniref:FkbM family methyltransferase n=1 Tax=Ignavibacterium album TaxID=591197 RepID=UPI001599983F|nr:MAG: FkbM family methyltransferase [Ignavibacteriota bacterium]
MDNNQKANLIKKIILTSNRNNTNRLKGWIYNFHKIVYYKSLEFLKKTSEFKVKTFWNRDINIILPESVSVSIWRNGFVESDVTIYLLNYLNKGDTFIDIGAHFGFYTLLAADIVGPKGQVLAFEPTISTFNQLSKNVSNSKNDNIRIYNLAASNSNTEMEFNDFGIINSAFNSFFENRGDKYFEGKKIIVNAVIVDDFIKENFSKSKISAIKIDAESAEFQVLSGLINVINKDHPIIILEVGDYSISGTKKSKELIELVESFDYQSFELDKKSFNIMPYIKKNIERYSNILFIPN